MLLLAVLVLIGEILLPVPPIMAEEVVCTDAPAYDEVVAPADIDTLDAPV